MNLLQELYREFELYEARFIYMSGPAPGPKSKPAVENQPEAEPGATEDQTDTETPAEKRDAEYFEKRKADLDKKMDDLVAHYEQTEGGTSEEESDKVAALDERIGKLDTGDHAQLHTDYDEGVRQLEEQEDADIGTAITAYDTELQGIINDIHGHLVEAGLEQPITAEPGAEEATEEPEETPEDKFKRILEENGYNDAEKIKAETGYTINTEEYVEAHKAGTEEEGEAENKITLTRDGYPSITISMEGDHIIVTVTGEVAKDAKATGEYAEWLSRASDSPGHVNPDILETFSAVEMIKFMSGQMNETEIANFEERVEAKEKEIEEREKADKPINENVRAKVEEILLASDVFKDALIPLLGGTERGGEMSRDEFKALLKEGDNGKVLENAIRKFMNDNEGMEDRLKGEGPELTKEEMGKLHLEITAHFASEIINSGRVEAAEQGEINLVNRILEDETPIEIMGEDGEPTTKTLGELLKGMPKLATTLSMQHEITEGTEGEGEGAKKFVEIGGKKIYTTNGLKATDLLGKGVLSTEVEASLKMLTDTASTPQQRKEALAVMQQGLTNHEAKLKQVRLAQGAATNPEQIRNALKGKGIEGLLVVAKYIPLMQKAWKKLDFKSIADFIKDINNPAQMEANVAKATEKYKNAVDGAAPEGTDNFKDLLELYHDPYGSEANALVGEDQPYRIILNSLAEAKLGATLGLGTISSIEGTADRTKITASVGGETIVAELTNGVVENKYRVIKEKGKPDRNEPILTVAQQDKIDADKTIADAKERQKIIDQGMIPERVDKDGVIKELGTSEGLEQVLDTDKVVKATITIGKAERKKGDLPPAANTVDVKYDGKSGKYKILVARDVTGKEIKLGKKFRNKPLAIRNGDSVTKTDYVPPAEAPKTEETTPGTATKVAEGEGAPPEPAATEPVPGQEGAGGGGGEALSDANK